MERESYIELFNFSAEYLPDNFPLSGNTVIAENLESVTQNYRKIQTAAVRQPCPFLRPLESCDAGIRECKYRTIASFDSSGLVRKVVRQPVFYVSPCVRNVTSRL